jgi:hypothetical protein
MYRRLSEGYVNAAHLAVFVPFFVALAALPGRRRIVAGGALVTFAAALYAVTIGGGYAPRYFIMAMAGTFFCVVLGAIALDESVKRWGGRPGRGRAHLPLGVGAACLGLALVTAGARFVAESKKYASYGPPPPLVPPSDIDFVREHTSPDDKIWTTDDPLLYVYSDRASAFRGGIVLDEIIEYYPGNTDAERLSVIREGLEQNRPKLVIFGNGMVGPRRKQRYTRALVMPFLRDGGYVRLSDRFYLRPD